MRDRLTRLTDENADGRLDNGWKAALVFLGLLMVDLLIIWPVWHRPF